ncbi:amino acid adenylation domain-containing protein [Solihabitans fulvus]|uniref:Amino acid adenylation domain-containing protein n=1 Tax=Solihabitans fulvus TaxID=1892852 RepID=A0A5B2WQN2_9PSEU|nr:non-ribosomal peptide synthetase [Solihabitans fulvus]KAA2252836.1 amino acid adenylation domain-containing protein [Solihabitans fulvus]
MSPTDQAVGVRRERIWLLSQLATEPSVHHNALSLRIHGPVDVATVTRALDVVLARHEVLRTVFSFRGGEIVPAVLDGPVALTVVEELRALPAADRAAELARLTEEQLRAPFDLAASPPVRCTLVRLGPYRYELLVVAHQIAADRRSLELLGEEIGAVYQALVHGDAPEAGPAGSSFGELAEDAEARLSGGDLADSLDFWKHAVADLPDARSLPYQRSRPELGTQATGRTEFTVRSTVAARLRELASAERTDVSTVVLAGVVTLLHRQLRASDLVLGVPTDLRDAASADVVGPLTETLPLRLRLPYDPTWREVVRVVRDGLRDVAAHREVPLQRLIEFARPERQLSMHPLFQILVAGAPAVPRPRTIGGVTFDPRLVDVARSPFDIEFRVADRDSLDGALSFQEELFARRNVDTIAEQLLHLLRQLAEDPDTRLSNVALIGGDERERILYGWNRTAVDYPRDALVHELFEQWADRTPQAPALLWEETGYTYAELDRRANQLAHYLRELGAGRETRIGLHFGYSAEWVVSALATLKVGAAYVPLDPSYPADRLAMMCRSADVEILLSHVGAGESPETPGVRRVLVDSEPAIADQPGDRLATEVRPDQLAYVMFTSGSTGRPKGIAVSHRNIVRTVRGITYTRFAPGDSVAQGSNISFDATTLETWGALLNGARLVGLRKSDLLEPQRLRAQLVENEIDMMFLPAALMKQLVAEAPATFASLRYFQSGGEQADYHTHRRIIANGVPENLINPYGPTETTVNATAYRTNDLTDDEQHVPIGFPLANTTCYVLDQYWQPVPAGVVGELFIGGDGVSRGYLGQPGLTAEKFVPDPYGEAAGARMYRTGDLARYRADGAIEFLGRADRQIKIRGFRVEPGEVEAAVLLSGQVKEVSVQVGDDAGGDHQLVAYLVPSAPDPDLAGLREFMREQVPSYMVPALYVPVPSLPLNANGKLDIRALAEFAPSASAQAEPAQSEQAEPSTATEGRLDALMTGVLALTGMGVHDDFFRAGGDSLKAVALVTRARTMFRLDIPLSAVFRNPTVASLAAEIDRLRAAPAAPAQPVRSRPEAKQDKQIQVTAPPVAAPAPQEVRPVARAGASTQDRVVEIWQEVLDVSGLGPDDDFFMLGGHSLKVTRVASRVKAVFGVNVPLRLLFANSTVKAFADAVDSLLEPSGPADPLPTPSDPAPADPVTGLENLIDEVRRIADEAE